MSREVTTVPSPSWPGYLVSSDGSITGPRGRILQTRNFGAGYRAVIMHLPGHVRRMVRVHRLVAEAFHGPAPTPRHEVAHWDGNPANNVATNLRWATSKENKADRDRHGRTFRPVGQLNPGAKLTEDDVLRIVRLVGGGMSRAQVAEDFGVSRGAVAKIMSGATWKHVRRYGQPMDENGCPGK